MISACPQGVRMERETRRWFLIRLRMTREDKLQMSQQNGKVDGAMRKERKKEKGEGRKKSSPKIKGKLKARKQIALGGIFSL